MTVHRNLLAIALAFATTHGLYAQQNGDPLAAGFANPPDSARPRTWWHWTNGNVTSLGIIKDLEWMKRAGIGGFQLVDVSAGGGQSVEPKVTFGTEAWYNAVKLSAEQAQRLGLEMSIFSCAGWSEAGGPWVKPEMAMKRLVWSETQLEGGHRILQVLPMPPSKEGSVRDSEAGGTPTDPPFYRDSSVVAYRTPDVSRSSTLPTVTTSNGEIDAAALLDGSLRTGIRLPANDKGSPTWLQFAYTEPFTARAFSLGVHGRIPVGRLLASSDGKSFHTIVTLPGPQGYHGASIRTYAFPPTTARFFRLELDGAGLTPAAVIHGGPVTEAKQYELTEAILFPDAHVNRWEDKGAFGSLMDRYDTVPTPTASNDAVIHSSDVVDLTANLRPDGTLDWEVPAGHWTVLRMGYTLTGARNRPSVPAGSGLEVDKLSSVYARQYFSGYTDPIAQHLGPLLGTFPHYMTMDSWEAGMQNWTDDMIVQFRKRRGYDPHPWLPVLAGRVVGSSDDSDRFLWDFRRTLADMFAEEFYATMTDELHKHGMESYAEASGVALEIPEDTLLNKSHVDIPMAEFWVHALHPESMYYVDVRGAASAAHIYGKPIVATESFTGGGYESPFTLKKIADYWFAQGVNRLVFHTSAHQPLDTAPGNTMVGTHINRNITWAEEARPFMDYITRTSWMLQQGKPVADLAYLLPEGAPSTMPFWGSGLQPAPPQGFDYDYLNADVLLHHCHVSDGLLKLDSGAAYRVLILPPGHQMTAELAGRLRDLVNAGLNVLGDRPTSSPSLMGYPGTGEALHQIVEDVWGDVDGVTANRHDLGKGTMWSGLQVSDLAGRLNLLTDFFTGSTPDQAPVWVHRHLPDRDVYFIANQSDGPVNLNVRLRSKARSVELWKPMDGSRTPADFQAGGDIDRMSGNRQPGLQPAAFVHTDEFTTVALSLAAREALFVVLSAKEVTPSVAPEKKVDALLELKGPWTISFPPRLGAPLKLRLATVGPWTENQDPGVRFFSGKATYQTHFNLPASAMRTKDGHTMLRFDDVRDMARIRLNGTDLGLVWAPPYVVDVSKALKAGLNTLEVDVTNEWSNRLLGDRTLPADQRVLQAVPASPFGPPPPLAPSGLIGGATLIRSRPFGSSVTRSMTYTASF